MTDSEIDALVEAVRTVVAEQALTLRTQLADARADTEALRAELHFEKALAAEHRRAAAESQVRLMKSIGDTLRDTLPAAVREAAERHLLRAAVDRAVPPTEATQ